MTFFPLSFVVLVLAVDIESLKLNLKVLRYVDAQWTRTISVGIFTAGLILQAPLDLHFLLRSAPTYVETSSSSVLGISSAHADSTGKMSTKLTAKKRYLPRIRAGSILLEELANNPNKERVSAFNENELPGLVRAMKLYGASLRTGEAPDGISRTTEHLANTFNDRMKLISIDSSSSEDILFDNLFQAKSALTEYIKFAKIE